jgi:hypothetical protein
MNEFIEFIVGCMIFFFLVCVCMAISTKYIPDLVINNSAKCECEVNEKKG